MTENKVTTRNKEGEKLVGLEVLPDEKKEKYPVVILVHGFGVTKEEGGMFDELARHLGKAGFLAYRFDFSGRGESEGDYGKTSLSKLSSDLGSIVEFVKSQPRVDVSKIGILGQSLGTITTVVLEPDIQALVLMGSVAHAKEILIKLFGDGYNPEGVSVRINSAGKKAEIGPQFWRDFDNHKPLESIKSFKCPILFIHGSEDDKVPLSEMEAYFESATTPVKEKLVLEGADHGLRPHRDKMYKAAVEWFARYLKNS